jgi:hypothetical protein
MPKKRPSPYTPYKKIIGSRQFNFNDLAGITPTIDESETFINESASGAVRQSTSNYIPAPPVFKEDEKSNFIKWSDLSLGYKILAISVSTIILVICPIVWFCSKVDTNVTDLKTDVKEIKTKIDKLTENSITNSSKIEHLEKTSEKRANR